MQLAPLCKVGGTQVIFYKKQNWRGKCYGSSGNILLSDMGQTGTKGFDTDKDTLFLTTALSYFHYNDIVPLDKAIKEQMSKDLPPQQPYYHVASMIPWTIGEWILQTPPSPPNSYWRQNLNNKVCMHEDVAVYLCTHCADSYNFLASGFVVI